MTGRVQVRNGSLEEQKRDVIGGIREKDLDLRAIVARCEPGKLSAPRPEFLYAVTRARHHGAGIVALSLSRLIRAEAYDPVTNWTAVPTPEELEALCGARGGGAVSRHHPAARPPSGGGSQPACAGGASGGRELRRAPVHNLRQQDPGYPRGRVARAGLLSRDRQAAPRVGTGASSDWWPGGRSRGCRPILSGPIEASRDEREQFERTLPRSVLRH